MGYRARLCLKTQQPNRTNNENKGWGCAWHRALAFRVQGSGLCPPAQGLGREKRVQVGERESRLSVKMVMGWGERTWVSAEGTAEPEWGEGSGRGWALAGGAKSQGATADRGRHMVDG